MVWLIKKIKDLMRPDKKITEKELNKILKECCDYASRHDDKIKVLSREQIVEIYRKYT